LKDFLKANRFQYQVEILKTECTDRCKQAPVACLQPQNIWLVEFNEKDWKQSLQEVFQNKSQ